MKQIVIEDRIYFIGKSAEVFAEMARVIAFSRYAIGWIYTVNWRDVYLN